MIDEGNRETPDIEVAISISAQREIQVFERLIEPRSIQPCKRKQTAFIELVNKTSSDEVLDDYVLDSLGQLREVTGSRLHEHYEEWPNDSVGEVPSLMFLPKPSCR